VVETGWANSSVEVAVALGLRVVDGVRDVVDGGGDASVDPIGDDAGGDVVATLSGVADSGAGERFDVATDGPVPAGEGRDCTAFVQPATAMASRPSPAAMVFRREGLTVTATRYLQRLSTGSVAFYSCQLVQLSTSMWPLTRGRSRSGYGIPT